MRIRSVVQGGMMVLLALGLTMCKQPAEQPATHTEEQAPTLAPPSTEAATPQVVVEQVRDMQARLKSARRNVRDGKAQEGSLELSEVAGVLSQYAAQSSDALKENLEYSASEFSSMAERVFGTPSVHRYEMDAALTRAFWGLAQYHYRVAADQWAGGQKPQTAAYLTATATYLDEAIGYFSGGLELESEALVQEIRQLARGLTSGITLDDTAVTAQIEDVGQRIVEYDQRVRQAIRENVEA